MAIKKNLSSFAVALMVAGLVFSCLGAVTAQSVPKPLVPSFTVKYVPSTYSVTETDPYTDETTTTQHPNSTIQVTIKNQSAPDSSHSVYYNIRVRPHFEGDWAELYPLEKLAAKPYDWDTETWTSAMYLYTQDVPLALQTPTQSSGGYTTITLPLDENPPYPLRDLPENAKVDFQVEAIIGHDAQYWLTQHALYPEYGGMWSDAVAYDSDSGWSSTQTIALGEASVNPTPDSSAAPSAEEGSPTPTQTGAASDSQVAWLMVEVVAAGLGAIIALLVAVIVLMHRKIRVFEGKQNGR